MGSCGVGLSEIGLTEIPKPRVVGPFRGAKLVPKQPDTP